MSQAAVLEKKSNECYSSKEDLSLVSSAKSGDQDDKWVLNLGYKFHMSLRWD